MPSMNVFQAFPNAIETWAIGKCYYSTIEGNVIDVDTTQDIHVIVDEGSSTDPNPSPNSQAIGSDTLLYCKPEELPTLDTAELTASYVVGNPATEKIYAIVDAGIGKNQHEGIIEHVELKLKQTEIGEYEHEFN